MRPTSRAVIALATTMCVSLCCVVQANSTPEIPARTCILLVRLFNEPFEDESAIPQIPLTFDAHIAIRAEVEETVSESCNFSAGDRAVFLIHSPTRTLGGYWFHDKRFYLTLVPSHSEEPGRTWDLVGVDWPLDNPGPYPEVLICGNRTYSVRTLVGDSDRRMFGPFSVFREGHLVASLDTIETLQSKPTYEDQVFVLDYAGDPDGRILKPRVRLEARGRSGTLTMGSESVELTCTWPTGSK
jgi:hypothetical protein